MNQYEAMFLFDPTFGGSFEKCEAEVRRLMDRAEAEILFCRKWDERRLAYRIKGRKRGVYVLVYFKAAPEKITPFERDMQIAENILRVLVVRADGVTLDMMHQAATKHGAEAAPTPPKTAAPTQAKSAAPNGEESAQKEAPSPAESPGEPPVGDAIKTDIGDAVETDTEPAAAPEGDTVTLAGSAETDSEPSS